MNTWTQRSLYGFWFPDTWFCVWSTCLVLSLSQVELCVPKTKKGENPPDLNKLNDWAHSMWVTISQKQRAGMSVRLQEAAVFLPNLCCKYLPLRGGRAPGHFLYCMLGEYWGFHHLGLWNWNLFTGLLLTHVHSRQQSKQCCLSELRVEGWVFEFEPLPDCMHSWFRGLWSAIWAQPFPSVVRVEAQLWTFQLGRCRHCEDRHEHTLLDFILLAFWRLGSRNSKYNH